MEFIESVRRNMTTAAYVQVTGRASRSEFWWFVLFVLLLGVVANIVTMILPIGLLSTLASIVTIVPGITTSVRRMHDIGKSGWWLLIGLIPILGWIVLIIWCAQKSEAGKNSWGVTERA